MWWEVFSLPLNYINFINYFTLKPRITILGLTVLKNLQLTNIFSILFWLVWIEIIISYKIDQICFQNKVDQAFKSRTSGQSLKWSKFNIQFIMSRLLLHNNDNNNNKGSYLCNLKHQRRQLSYFDSPLQLQE